jgi:hypothetical protein
MVSEALWKGNRSKRLPLAALLGAFLALVVSCASSDFVYVSSSDRNAYFKVPGNWKFFDKRQILVASGQSLSGATDKQFSWLIGFDADPHAEVSHVVGIADAPKYPVIEARVQSLPSVVRDQLSLGGLRNWVYPVDRLVQANAGEILAYKDIVLNGGLRGSEITFDVVLSGISGPTEGGNVIRVTQVAVVDPATNKLYLFMLRCESHCYRDNKTLLDTIVNSWTVKER